MTAVLPLTTPRVEALRWLVTNFKAQLPGKQIEPGPPGDKIAKESIYAGVIEGTFSQEVMVEGRRVFDDQFEIPFEVQVVGGKDLLDALDRINLLLAGLHEVMANNVTMDEEVPGILSAEPTTLTGPLVGRSPEGIRGFATLTIAVHARIF